MDDVKRWAKAFYGTEDVYEATKQMTKSEIEEAILWRQQKINDRESLIEEGYSEADADTMIEYYKEQIESLKASYQKAPDDDERKKRIGHFILYLIMMMIQWKIMEIQVIQIRHRH